MLDIRNEPPLPQTSQKKDNRPRATPKSDLSPNGASLARIS